MALAVGQDVSGIVGGYRGFVHGLVAMLHLPHIPQIFYDAFGIAAFSVRRGLDLQRRDRERLYREMKSFFQERVGPERMERFYAAAEKKDVRAMA